MPAEEANPFLTFGTAPVIQPAGGAPATRSSSSERSRIVLAVVVFGAFVTAQALVSLVGGLKLLSFGDVGGVSLLTIFDVGFVILGVGLITRRELARAVYVVFAVINLIFLTLGMIAVLGLVAISSTSQATSDVNYAGLLLVFLLAAFPLVFLTRPSVKAVFS
jgi:hypothetical protein